MNIPEILILIMYVLKIVGSWECNGTTVSSEVDVYYGLVSRIPTILNRL